MMRWMLGAFAILVVAGCTPVGAVTTAAVVGEIKDSANSLIGRSEQAADYVAARLGQEALMTLRAWEAGNAGLLDRAFDGIDRSQRTFLNQLRTSVAELDIDMKLDRAEDALDQVYRLTNETTFRNYPTVFRYRGSVIVPGDRSTTKVVTIRGANLRVGSPTIEVGGQKFAARRPADGVLQFELPVSMFPKSATEITRVAATLKLYQEDLIFFTKPVSYDLDFLVLPDRVGDAVMRCDRVDREVQERWIEQAISHNSNSRNEDCRSFSWTPSVTSGNETNPPRYFDAEQSSIRRTSGNSRGRGQDWSIRDVGASFRICAWRGVFDKDGGFAHYSVRIREYWHTEKETPVTDDKMLSWSDETFSLPGECRRPLVELRSFQGRRYTLSASGAAGRYVQVDFDESARVIHLRPQIPEDVTRL